MNDLITIDILKQYIFTIRNKKLLDRTKPNEIGFKVD